MSLELWNPKFGSNYGHRSLRVAPLCDNCFLSYTTNDKTASNSGPVCLVALAQILTKRKFRSRSLGRLFPKELNKTPISQEDS